MNSEKYVRIISDVKKRAAKAWEDIKGAASAVKTEHGVDISRLKTDPLLRLLRPALYFIGAFLFAGTRTTLDTYPFGIAFFAASGSMAPFSYAGAVLRLLVGRRDVLINLAVYSLLLALRLLAGTLYPAGSDEAETEKGAAALLKRLEDSLRVRMAISVIGALSLGAYSAIANGFTLASLGGFLLMCTLCPALTFLYFGIMEEHKDALSALYREVGEGAVAVSFVFSLSGFSLLSIDISIIVAFVLTQYATVRRGWVKGAVLGLFFGLSLPAALVPTFALSAVAAGILYRVSPYIAVSAASMVSLSWVVYAGGYRDVLGNSAELILGGVITAALFFTDVLAVLPRRDKEEAAVPNDVLLEAERGRTTSVRGRIASEAEAFSGMSEMLFRLSDKLRRPSIYDIREMAERESSSVCRRCRSRETCWVEHESELSSAISKLSETLRDNGSIQDEEIPGELSSLCRSPDNVVGAVSKGYASLLSGLIDRDKTEVMAFDYGAMSAVLRDVISEREGEYEINPALSQNFSDALKKEMISARRVCVFGERRKTVFISDIKLSGLHIGEDDLRQLAKKVCGGEFSSPTFELSGQLVNATLKSTRSRAVLFERAQSKMDESAANGDVASGFECRDDRYCALISDGMGSGREAAFTSGMCALFIERMMSAGNSASVTLKMLNCLLRAKGSECSATVDLFDLDLLTGKARFIKSGAAPSFVVRGTSVYKISSRTVPVGIIKALDAEETTIDVSVGDIIVLVSDGITKCEDDCAWLYSMLSSSADRQTSDIAHGILREAERRLGRGDDATVCVLRITEPPVSAFL